MDMILVKKLAGGITAVLVMWIVILAVNLWRWKKYHPPGQLVAAAGGWTYLLHHPLVLLLLTAAFGIGLYWTAR